MSSSSLAKLSKKNPKSTSLVWIIGEKKQNKKQKNALTVAHKGNKDTPKNAL